MDEDQAAKIVVRKHGAVGTQKSIDLTPEEAAQLKVKDDQVIFTLTLPDQPPRDVMMSIADFRRVVSDDVVQKAEGVQGRVASSYR